ncbi:MAG TPA: hypothetical protein VKR53_17725 [Puia sp.]|nr:hypothetical protein [Puia sp.]
MRERLMAQEAKNCKRGAGGKIQALNREGQWFNTIVDPRATGLAAFEMAEKNIRQEAGIRKSCCLKIAKC